MQSLASGSYKKTDSLDLIYGSHDSPRLKLAAKHADEGIQEMITFQAACT